MIKTLAEIKKDLQDRKPVLVTKYKIKEIGIFGSYVRGEQQPDSDLDILVDFEEFPSLLEFVGIEEEISQYLDIEVDLVMKTGLKPRLGQRILQEVVYV